MTTGWPRIKKRLSEMGVSFDPWQEGACQIALGKDAAGKYAATVGGVTMSIPRQVGKTFMVGSLLIAMCLEFPGLKVVWTAHHLRTSTNTFRSMQSMVKRRRVAPHLAPNGIRTANGEQEIRFANGSIIMFGARSQGFGRGFEEVDVEVFDEAQILTEKALEDMIAATNQAKHKHGALLFFMGTPPRPTDPGEAFANKRKRALAGKLKNGVYIECSADPDADLDDHEQWKIANASYPERTPHEAMLRLRENLPSDDSWRREGLGVWDDFERSALVLPHWYDRLNESPEPAPAALAVAVDLDREWLSVAAASGGPTPHIGAVLRGRLDTDRVRLVSEIARISKQYGCPVALDRKGPAGSLERELRAAGVKILGATVDDYATACGDLFDAVEAGTVTQGNYDELNDAVRDATQRKLGDRWAWARRNGDISMLEAATLALWAVRRKVAGTQPVMDYA